MDDAIPQKRCNKCEKKFPATREFFTTCNVVKDGLRPLCKKCRQAGRRKTLPVPEGKKRCSRCKQDLLATHIFFPFRDRSKDKLNEYCRECAKAIYREKLSKPVSEERPLRMFCEKCGEEKDFTLDFFYREPTYRYGLNISCKVCVDKRNRRYEHSHRSETNARARRYLIENRLHKLLLRARNRQRNRDRMNAQDRQRRATHPEYFRQKKQRYLRTERGRIQSRAYSRTRKMRKKGAEGRYSAQDVQRMYSRQQGCCYYCSIALGIGKRTYHVDHVIPITRGGSNHPENLVLACPICNMSKHNKLLSEWVDRPYLRGS